MIDANTAKLIGLDIEWAQDTKKHYGSFSGVSGSSNSYLGVSKSPVTVQFAPGVYFKLKELKVFDYPEPLLLIGTDLLGFSPSTNCTFSYLGVNPISATGEVVFYDRARKRFIACELVYSPTTHSTLPVGNETSTEGDTKAIKKYLSTPTRTKSESFPTVLLMWLP
jgi:hypothetical protein